MKPTRPHFLVACASVILLAIFSGAANPARALSPDCCDYIVNTSRVPASCFPITILTNWSGGQNDVITVTAPGYVSRHFPFPCPPAPTLVNVTMTTTGGCVLTWARNNCDGCQFIDIV